MCRCAQITMNVKACHFSTCKLQREATTLSFHLIQCNDRCEIFQTNSVVCLFTAMSTLNPMHFFFLYATELCLVAESLIISLHTVQCVQCTCTCICRSSTFLNAGTTSTCMNVLFKIHNYMYSHSWHSHFHVHVQVYIRFLYYVHCMLKQSLCKRGDSKSL